MVSPQRVFTCPFNHVKLQILYFTGVTATSLYLSFSPSKATNLYYMVVSSPQTLSFSPCEATNLSAWCHRKQSLLILFTTQSYKSYYMVSPQTVFTYPFHHAKLHLNLTIWCHRKQSLLIRFTMQSYKSHCMVSPQTVFTCPFITMQS